MAGTGQSLKQWMTSCQTRWGSADLSSLSLSPETLRERPIHQRVLWDGHGRLSETQLWGSVFNSDLVRFKLSTVQALKSLSQNPGDRRAADDLEGTLLSVELW